MLKEDIIKKGEAHYYKRILTSELEKRYKGKIIAIDPDTGDYFMGDSVIEACQKGEKKYPEKVFLLKRIGYKFVHSVKILL